MSDFKEKHQRFNPNKLKPLTRLMVGLSVMALIATACQKSHPLITATVPNTDIVLTFVPSGKDVKVIELAAYQPDKRLHDYNVGDVINAFANVSDTQLDPNTAAACADNIVRINRVNLKPETDGSGKPSSTRTVPLPEGGLIIPTDTCGDLKTNSTPIASPEPKQIPTSVPIATLQTPETKALINNENIGVVFGMLCAPILGFGAIFGGLLALRGRKEKSKNNTQLVSNRTNEEKKPQVPAILDVVSLDGVLCQVHGGGGYVRDLDSQKISPINWKDYRLVNKFGLPVNVINDEKIRNRLKLDPSTPRISDKQIESIHWSEGSPPELKGFVTAYGFFKHK